MRSLSLPDDHLASGFLSLSRQLQTPVTDDTLFMPREWGHGMVRGFLLEEGLYLRYARVSCRETTTIRRPARQPESETIFSLCYLLSSHENNVLLYSNNRPFAVQLQEGVVSHSIELLMEWDWMQQHLSGMEEKVRSIECTLMQEATSLLTDMIRPAEEELLGEIESELGRAQINGLSLRGRLLLLLSCTIGRWPATGDVQPLLRKTWHMQTIRQVEQRLVHSLEDMLPPQKELAREFALSESTLKRHFKAVYGKTMYEYYLEKKMGLAKRLLQEKKISVTETAYRLGYEKVSAFISMFKKVHNVLPGSLK